MNDELMARIKQQYMDGCRHFNGTDSKVCKAGVPFASVIEPPDPEKKKPMRLPCYLKGTFGGPDLPCEKRSIMGPEEAEREAMEFVQIVYVNAAARKAAKEDAKAKGFGRGNGGRGEIACPKCKTGTLRYSVASINGHMHGRCTTQQCVSWME